MPDGHAEAPAATTEATAPPVSVAPIVSSDTEPPPLAAALLACAPAMRRRLLAFTLDDYRRRFDATSGPLPCFPPPLQSALNLPRHKGGESVPPNCSTPFVTLAAGGLPRGVPSCVSEAVGTYLVGGASRAPPNIDVDFQTVACSSNGEARRVLASASTAVRRWLSILRPLDCPLAACCLLAGPLLPRGRWIETRLRRAARTGQPSTCPASSTRPGCVFRRHVPTPRRAARSAAADAPRLDEWNAPCPSGRGGDGYASTRSTCSC
jgi:hypothetical protein